MPTTYDRRGFFRTASGGTLAVLLSQRGLTAAHAPRKHLYIEKPMTRRLEEAFEIQDAAKRARRLVQVGSHGCSDPKWLQAREIVKSGHVGTATRRYEQHPRDRYAG